MLLCAVDGKCNTARHFVVNDEIDIVFLSASLFGCNLVICLGYLWRGLVAYLIGRVALAGLLCFVQ
jgi:hypothetical protein